MADRRTRGAHAGLLAGIERARELADDRVRFAAADAAVSTWSVGHHLEHLLMAERRVLAWIERALERPQDWPSTGGPTRRGRMVILGGRIPRGLATAPEGTRPAGSSAPEIGAGLTDLHAACTGLAARLDEVSASRARYEHPILGCFRPGQWLRFLDVHHRHHEKIIGDILS